MRVLNDVNYAIQKFPNSRIQICHVDRLLKYEGDIPAIWVKYDQEKSRNHENEIVSAPLSNEREKQTNLLSDRKFQTSRQRRDELPWNIEKDQSDLTVGDGSPRSAGNQTSSSDSDEATVNERAWIEEMEFQRQRRRWLHRNGYSKQEIEIKCANKQPDRRFDVLGFSRRRRRCYERSKFGNSSLTYRCKKRIGVEESYVSPSSSSDDTQDQELRVLNIWKFRKKEKK